MPFVCLHTTAEGWTRVCTRAGSEDLGDIDHFSQAFVWNSLPGTAWDFCQRLCTGIVWPGTCQGLGYSLFSGLDLCFLLFPASLTACAKYAGRKCLPDHLISIWDCHLVLRVTSLVSGTERVSVENEPHRLSVASTKNSA